MTFKPEEIESAHREQVEARERVGARTRAHVKDILENPERHRMLKDEYTQEEIRQLCGDCCRLYIEDYTYNYVKNIFVRIK